MAFVKVSTVGSSERSAERRVRRTTRNVRQVETAYRLSSRTRFERYLCIFCPVVKPCRSRRVVRYTRSRGLSIGRTTTRLFLFFFSLLSVYTGAGRRGRPRPLRSRRHNGPGPVRRVPRTVAVLGRRARRLPVRRASRVPVRRARRVPVQGVAVAGRVQSRGRAAGRLPGRRVPVPGPGRAVGPRRRPVARRGRRSPGRRSPGRRSRVPRGQVGLRRLAPAVPVRVHGPRLADRRRQGPGGGARRRRGQGPVQPHRAGRQPQDRQLLRGRRERFQRGRAEGRAGRRSRRRPRGPRHRGMKGRAETNRDGGTRGRVVNARPLCDCRRLLYLRHKTSTRVHNVFYYY